MMKTYAYSPASGSLPAIEGTTGCPQLPGCWLSFRTLCRIDGPAGEKGPLDETPGGEVCRVILVLVLLMLGGCATGLDLNLINSQVSDCMGATPQFVDITVESRAFPCHAGSCNGTYRPSTRAIRAIEDARVVRHELVHFYQHLLSKPFHEDHPCMMGWNNGVALR